MYIRSKAVLQEIENHEKANLEYIENAFKTRLINKEACDYLKNLYQNSDENFKKIFQVLGKCFGAPKTNVTLYDNINWQTIDKTVTIQDINPYSSYIVHHRLDFDPMRNQFFKLKNDHNIDILVSSIVSIVIGRQKLIDRAIKKITTKYYQAYIDEVIDVIDNYLSKININKEKILNEIKNKFKEEYITDASCVLLKTINKGQEQIFLDIVRRLDKITPPQKRLCDVYRVKCLFDLIPQARFFIESIIDKFPNKIISKKDSFYDTKNKRNYRDAKIVLNIGDDKQIIPIEIICQVRTFFEHEILTHDLYKEIRENNCLQENLNEKLLEIHLKGIKKYNYIVVNCINSLFERVGWNILYLHNDDFFDGFPKKVKMYHNEKIVNYIMGKINQAVRNEIFCIQTSPIKLNKMQEEAIFRFMANFILTTIMPYKDNFIDELSQNTVGEKLFKFILKELQRYY